MSPPSHDDRNPGAPAQGTGASGFLAEDVSAYLDGELTDAELEAFEAELERNASLRGDLDEIREVAEWLADEGPTDAPMGFANRVMARIEAEHPAPPSWWAWLRRPFGLPLEGVVVALSAALVLLLVLPRSDVAQTAKQERPARQSPIERSVEPPPTGSRAVGTEALGEASDAIEAENNTYAPTTKTAPARRDVSAEKKSVEVPQLRDGTDEDPEKPHADPPAVGTAEPPTDAYHVPPPSEVDSPLAQAPLGKPAPPPPDQVMAAPLNRRTLPFTMTSDDPAMLARVLKLSARFGGAFDAQGREIADPTLSSGTREVFVRVPQNRLNDFEKQLDALGYQLVPFRSAGLLASDEVTVQLRLTVGFPDDAASNAAEGLSTQ